MLNALIGPQAAEPSRRASRTSAACRARCSRTFRFGVSFYMVAMLFILFDIEVVFLYPVGVILKAAALASSCWSRSSSSSSCCWSPWSTSGARGPRLEVKREKLRALAPLEEPGSPRTSRPPAPRPRPAARRPRGRRPRGARRGGGAHDHARQGAGLGPRQLDLPADLRPRLLRDRDDVDGQPALRHRALRRRGLRASPRQADMLILSGRVSIKMAPVVRRIYDQMLEPKWVISMGACSSSGGHVRQLRRRPGRRQVHAGRHPRPRLPAAARGADVRLQQAAAA